MEGKIQIRHFRGHAQGPRLSSGTPPVGGAQAFAKQTLPQGEFISPEDVRKWGSPRGLPLGV